MGDGPSLKQESMSLIPKTGEVSGPSTRVFLLKLLLALFFVYLLDRKSVV